MLTRYVLDGIPAKETPAGWDRRITTIKHDRQLKGRLVTEDTTLDWCEDGYLYIKAKHSESICGEISVQVQTDEFHNGNWVTEFAGKIKMPDCEFSVAPYGVRTPVIDNGFYARINNNKSIKTTVDNTKSKNDKIIAAAMGRTVSFFNTASGAYTYTDRTGHTIHELFRFLIDFMTDGEVGYLSETFDDDDTATGEYANFAIFNGTEIRLAATNDDDLLELSFVDLYTEINKKFNIGFRMEYVAGRPYMRIEKASWFFKNATSRKFDYVRPIKRKVDAEYLYSTIELGSDKTDDTVSLGFPENTRFFGFKDEQYYPMGQCNIEKSLDLRSNWIISHNIIQDIVENGNDAYDDEIFIVEIEDLSATPNLAHQSNWFVAPPPYYYNEHLTNEHVMARWLDGIPTSVAAQLGVDNNRFRAERTFAGGTFVAFSPNPGGNAFINDTQPFQFDNDFTPPDFYDTNNRYGNGTGQGTPVTAANSRYTANAAGIFTFDVNYLYRVLHADNNFTLYTQIDIKHYTAGNVLVGTESFSRTQGHPAPGVYGLQITRSISMNATDYVVVRRLQRADTNVFFPGSYIEMQELAGSTFACTFASIDEGGQYATVDINNQLFMKYSARTSFSKQDAEAIIADTAQKILLNCDGVNNFSGWIEEIKFDRFKGQADISTRGRQIDEPLIK